MNSELGNRLYPESYNYANLLQTSRTKFTSLHILDAQIYNILVVGYYGHHNIGDEQYKISITYVIQNIISHDKNIIKPSNIDYIDCDQLYQKDISNYNIILLGGGDVLNHYFLDKLNKKFVGELKRPKIIAFSVGIPYNSIFLEPENLKKLDILDSIFLRTKQDISLFSQYYDPKRLYYLPDTSCFLLDTVPIRHITPELSSSKQYQKLFHTLRLLSRTKKIININLCRHIYHSDPVYTENYNNIIRELVLFIEKLVQQNYIVVLIPFNTKPIHNKVIDNKNTESDILIQNDIMRHIKSSLIFNVDFELTISEILSLYQFFYISIPMRFHGCLFSLHANVPMIPVYTTKKIKNLLLDIDWKYEYPLEKNEKDLPTNFDSNKMMSIFSECVKNYKKNKLLLNFVYKNFKHIYNSISSSLYKEFYNMSPQLPSITVTPYNSDDATCNLLPPRIIRSTSATKQIDIIPNISNTITDEEENIIYKIEQKLENFAKENGYKDFRNIKDPNLKQIAVCIVSYFLTKQIDSNYNHGLLEKMFSSNYNYKKEWDWVLQDFQKKTNTNDSSSKNEKNEDIYDNPDGIFNIGYIDQNDRSGAHRSGWKYVYDNIKYLNNSNSEIKLDLYLDRTFHWKLDIYKQIGIIPYITPWVGFIHHTFDTTFSDYNNHKLLQCPEFIESLRTCRGLIVLSKYLKKQFEEAFLSMQISVPVFVMHHPTLINNIPLFDMNAFLNNPNKKIVNIGGWLRNIFSFYQLELSDNYCFDIDQMLINNHIVTNIKQISGISRRWERTIKFLKKICCKCCKKKHKIPFIKMEKFQKVALKGKFMDNYFPKSISEIKQIFTDISYNKNIGEHKKYCSQTNYINNNWLKHMMDYIDNLNNNIEIINTLENAEYDELLTKNIVFINLIDGSAINTLIECVVRNTPIIINRHPAVVEVLGDNYPLYYTNICEVDDLLKNTLLIRDAHLYMKYCIDKPPYSIDFFIEELKNIKNFISVV